MELSDSLPQYITAVPLGFAMRAWVRSPRPGAGPPGSRTQCFRACQGSSTPPGRPIPRHTGMVRVAFRVFGARRHLEMARFRGSIPCLHVPLSTLRRLRYRGLRMTRGQRGWLTLRCLGLAPFNIVPVCPGTPEREGFAAKAPPRHGGTNMDMRVWTRNGQCNLTHRFPSPCDGAGSREGACSTGTRSFLHGLLHPIIAILQLARPYLATPPSCKVRTRRLSVSCLQWLRVRKHKGTPEQRTGGKTSNPVVFDKHV